MCISLLTFWVFCREVSRATEGVQDQRLSIRAAELCTKTIGGIRMDWTGTELMEWNLNLLGCIVWANRRHRRKCLELWQLEWRLPFLHKKSESSSPALWRTPNVHMTSCTNTYKKCELLSLCTLGGCGWMKSLSLNHPCLYTSKLCWYSVHKIPYKFGTL